MDQFDFVNRANSEYIDKLYARYKNDPRSVDERWRIFFSGFDLAGGRPAGGAAPAEGGHISALEVNDLVNEYRTLGHFVADLDPLGHNRPNHPLLELGEFNMSREDLDRVVGQGTFVGKTDGTLRDL